MAIQHWADSPSLWNRLTLTPLLASATTQPTTYILPGAWDVQFACRRKMDVKKAKGVDGARIKDEGYELPQLELIGKLVTREHWVELQKIIRVIHPRKKGGKRDTYSIEHPKTALLGINAVYITEIAAPRIERGVMSLTIRALEYVPAPKPVQGQKKTATPSLQEQDREFLQDQLQMSIAPDDTASYQSELNMSIAPPAPLQSGP